MKNTLKLLLLSMIALFAAGCQNDVNDTLPSNPPPKIKNAIVLPNYIVYFQINKKEIDDYNWYDNTYEWDDDGVHITPKREK